MRYPLVVSFILLIVASYSCDRYLNTNTTGLEQLADISAANAGFNEKNISALDSLFNDYIARQAIASAEIIVVKNGGIAYHKSVSPSGVSEGRDSIYRIMSMTKAITSVAAMQLYEQGKFLLDDPIENYIPEFKDMQVLQSVNHSDSTYTSVRARRKITIRDLLRHTSGLAYSFSSPEMQIIYTKEGVVEAFTVGREVNTLADNMKILGDVPLVHEPGTRYTYGVSTDVLGYLIEVISGQSFDKYLKEHIFDPLGMVDSYFFVPEEKAGRLAQVYANTEDKPIVKMESSLITEYHTMTGGKFFSGGGGLCTTAKDYAIFLQMLLNGGKFSEARILGSKTIDLMVTNQLANINPPAENGGADERKFAFGLGFELGTEHSYRKNPGSLQRYSWGGALSTTFWWDKENDLAVVGMIQMRPFFHRDMWRKMEVIIYGAII